MPRVDEVQSAICLLPGNWARDDQGPGGLITESGTLSIAVPEQEIGVILAVPVHRFRRVLRPYTGKRDQAAAGVGLEVVVVTLFELSAPNKSMTTADHCDLRRNVELRIEIVNRALALTPPHDRIASTKACR